MRCVSRSHSWALWLLGPSVVGAHLFGAGLVTAGLYECRDESGAAIYTDSPAQLDRCQPVASGGTSRLGLVGGTLPSSSPAPSVAAPEPAPSYPPSPVPFPIAPGAGLPAIAPPEGLVPSGGYPAGFVGGASEGPPCVPGINPLNPYSGPPCSTASQIDPQSPSPSPAPPVSSQP